MEESYLKVTQQCSNELVLTFPEINEVAVDIITLEKSTGPELVAEVFTTPGDTLNEIVLPMGMDGLFNITHLTIPSVDWYNAELEKKYNSLNKFKTIYVTDCSKIFKLKNNEWVEVDPLVFTTNIDLTHTTVFKHQKHYFLTWYLWKCYVYLSQQVIQRKLDTNRNPRGYNNGKLNKVEPEDEFLIYQRDFIWVTLKVISYLVELCRLEQAQSILEKVESCKGFCYSALNHTNEPTRYSCGRTTGTIVRTGCGCRG